tara:strand:+ start:1219 stop:1320 length:102 start_codon:yes stop_codon:yes gene_type:complete
MTCSKDSEGDSRLKESRVDLGYSEDDEDIRRGR